MNYCAFCARDTESLHPIPGFATAKACSECLDEIERAVLTRLIWWKLMENLQQELQ